MRAPASHGQARDRQASQRHELTAKSSGQLQEYSPARPRAAPKLSLAAEINQRVRKSGYMGAASLAPSEIKGVLRICGVPNARIAQADTPEKLLELGRSFGIVDGN